MPVVAALQNSAGAGGIAVQCASHVQSSSIFRPHVLKFVTIEFRTWPAVQRRRFTPNTEPGNAALERDWSPIIVKFATIGLERPEHTSWLNGATSLLSASIALSPNWVPEGARSATPRTITNCALPR